MQVLFNGIPSGSHFIDGEPAPEGALWVRADIRIGRTDGQKKAISERIAADISATAGVSREDVRVYVSDIPAIGVLEFGEEGLPTPGQSLVDWSSRCYRAVLALYRPSTPRNHRLTSQRHRPIP